MKKMKLSDFFDKNSVLRDAEFINLGYLDNKSPGLLVYADNIESFNKANENPNVAALITNHFLAKMPSNIPGLAIVNLPRVQFYSIHTQLHKEHFYKFPYELEIGIGCKIHPSAIISDNCKIGDHVVVGEYVVIKSNVCIGSNVVIEPAAKVGVEGILYNKTEQGVTLIPHGGYVKIEENAILMTNSIIAKSIHNTDYTGIGRSALIGLGSIIGHESKIGDEAIISNQCVIARRALIGKRAFIGTNSTIKENITIGENARVMAGSVVIRNVDNGASVSGNFATDHKKHLLEFARKQFR